MCSHCINIEKREEIAHPRRLRSLDSLPDRWTLESSAEEIEQPMLRFQRHFALEGLHNRIFRLHRPFSTRVSVPLARRLVLFNETANALCSNRYAGLLTSQVSLFDREC